MSDAQDADDMAEGNTSASVEEDVEANVETALREFPRRPRRVGDVPAVRRGR